MGDPEATLSVTDLVDPDMLKVVSTMLIGPAFTVLVSDDEVIVADESGERRYKLDQEEKGEL